MPATQNRKRSSFSVRGDPLFREQIKQSFFLISLAFYVQKLIAGGIDNTMKLFFGGGGFHQDHRFPFSVRGGPLFTASALQIASFTWLSHMPSVFDVTFSTKNLPLL